MFYFIFIFEIQYTLNIFFGDAVIGLVSKMRTEDPLPALQPILTKICYQPGVSDLGFLFSLFFSKYIYFLNPINPLKLKKQFSDDIAGVTDLEN